MAVRDDFASGEVLTATDLNDTFASKLDLAGGKILQIVRDSDGTRRQTTSTTFVDVTGLAVTITPQKSDSAIIVISSFLAQGIATNPAATEYAITDSGNNVLSGAKGVINIPVGTNTAVMQVLIGYNAPATTSAVTYKMRFRTQNATTTARIDSPSYGLAQIYAIEVSA